MNENTTRTEAHKIFAALYRKPRSPEHQAKVDEIITRSNDVFIRIDLIKKLDEQYEKNERNKLKQGNEEDKKNPSQTMRTKTVDREEKDTKETTQVHKKVNHPIHKSKEKETEIGFFERIFGGGSDIAKFAKETKAIELGLLGRRPTISPNVEKIFKFLKEEEIIATAQALKYSEQVGWKIWNPLEYNIIVNYGRFFNAFISLDSLFRDEISPEVFLGRSTKMILYYIRMLNRSDTKEVVLEKVPALIKMEPKLAPKLDLIMKGLSYTLTLETRRPTLKDAITAFYVVMHKKIPSWEEIEKSMNAGTIDSTKYNAPPDVLKYIEVAVAKVSNDIQAKKSIVFELDSIRKNYFKTNSNGEIDLSIVDMVVDEFVSYYYADTPHQHDTLRSNIRNSPPKLLQTLCRDIQTLYLPMFEGYIKVDANGPKDILVFQTGLFLPEIEKITLIIRNLDMFNRKFQNFNYNFQKFYDDLSKGTSDQVETQLMKLIQDAADFMCKFAKKLTIIIDNDKLARDAEKSGNIHEKVLLSKDKPIEDIKIMQRFIPHADYKIITQNRVNGMSIKELLLELTTMLFNYAYLFRDKTIVEIIGSHNKYDSELKKLYTEYERLAGKPYVDGANN